MIWSTVRAGVHKLEASLGLKPGSLIRAALRLHYGPTRRYVVGGRAIRLPGSHRLPHYQKTNRLYDRFLSYLACALTSPDRLIIDVGANVGDTLYSIYDACLNPVLCVEADLQFFTMLVHNVADLPGGLDRVVCEHRLVGTGRFNGCLVSNGSTAQLSIHTQRVGPIAGPTATDLDSIVSECGFRHDRVSLIKVDTDGFDADVLLSGSRIIELSRPALFWENEFSTPLQRHNLETFYDYIKAMGYDNLWVFDNLGNLILSECNFSHLLDFNRYVASQDSYGCPRTIWYTDVLAAPTLLLESAREAVRVYRQDLIETKPPRR